MKARFTCVALFAVVLMLVGGCGGGSGGSSEGGSGTLSVNATDAKPAIDANPTEVWITFEEVRAHKSGGGWVTLALEEKPLSINLLAFSDGTWRQLVPPAQLESGHYTQLRFDVSRAYMVIKGSAVEINLDVPSGFLRIDTNFDFDVPDGGAVGLTVDFDLSQSIVDEGNGTYKLKPVLHLVDTDGAATIHGAIKPDTFGDSSEVEVTVIRDRTGNKVVDDDDEVYTKVVVTQDSPGVDTEFRIFWLVPNESYIVQIMADSDANGTLDKLADEIDVPATDVKPGEVAELGSI
jgi:hypothetical protein